VPLRWSARDPLTWPGDELVRHPAFAYQGTTFFPWQRNYTANEFAAFLASTSCYQVLDPGIRRQLLMTITHTIGSRPSATTPADDPEFRHQRAVEKILGFLCRWRWIGSESVRPGP